MKKFKQLVIVGNTNNLLIDARLLHQQLQVSSRFNDWIRNRINEFGFEHDKDFYSNFSKSIFGRKPKDYHLTMDMAKELAMLERNEMGRMVRRYFIEVEKQAREAANTGRMLPKSIHSMELNGRKMYPYRKLALKLGYASSGSLYARRRRYPNHFIEFNKLVYCTEEMANLMAMWKSTVRHRETIRDMQPVLPLGFGNPLEIGGFK